MFGLGVALLHAIGVSVLLSGCGGGSVQTFYSTASPFDTNYATFDHPFTEAGAGGAKARAESQCAGKKQVAVMTSRACTLSRCTTSFQCMSPEDAAGYQQAPPARK
ncbi:MAG: hypothetical protein IT529_06460 [Burkholderiales bacterium]|nr:hypothetical protein [Burkholderiales bacterium]